MDNLIKDPKTNNYTTFNLYWSYLNPLSDSYISVVNYNPSKNYLGEITNKKNEYTCVEINSENLLKSNTLNISFALYSLCNFNLAFYIYYSNSFHNVYNFNYKRTKKVSIDINDLNITKLNNSTIVIDLLIESIPNKIPDNGLINNGSICYINALLQVLNNLSYFKKIIYNSVDRSPIVSALQSVFYSLLTSKNPVSTKNLTKAFGWSDHELNIQQDVQEFNLILSSEVLNNKYNIFEGKIITTIKCSNVDYKSDKIESFSDVSLTLKDNIYSSLDTYTAEEILKDSNMYDAGKFGKQIAKKECKFYELPSVLFLQIKRMEYSLTKKSMVKVNSPFEFYEEIDLSKYCHSNINENNALYSLFAVIVHSGSATKGHFYSYVKKKDYWIIYDDEDTRIATSYEAIYINFGYPRLIYKVKNKEISSYFANTESNAYLLTYIKNSDKDKILQRFTAQDIPQEIRNEYEKQKSYEIDILNKAQNKELSLMNIAIITKEMMINKLGKDTVKSEYDVNLEEPLYMDYDSRVIIGVSCNITPRMLVEYYKFCLVDNTNINSCNALENKNAIKIFLYINKNTNPNYNKKAVINYNNYMTDEISNEELFCDNNNNIGVNKDTFINNKNNNNNNNNSNIIEENIELININSFNYYDNTIISICQKLNIKLLTFLFISEKLIIYRKIDFNIEKDYIAQEKVYINKDNLIFHYKNINNYFLNSNILDFNYSNVCINHEEINVYTVSPCFLVIFKDIVDSNNYNKKLNKDNNNKNIKLSLVTKNIKVYSIKTNSEESESNICINKFINNLNSNDKEDYMIHMNKFVYYDKMDVKQTNNSSSLISKDDNLYLDLINSRLNSTNNYFTLINIKDNLSKFNIKDKEIKDKINIELSSIYIDIFCINFNTYLTNKEQKLKINKYIIDDFIKSKDTIDENMLKIYILDHLKENNLFNNICVKYDLILTNSNNFTTSYNFFYNYININDISITIQSDIYMKSNFTSILPNSMLANYINPFNSSIEISINIFDKNSNYDYNSNKQIKSLDLIITNSCFSNSIYVNKLLTIIKNQNNSLLINNEFKILIYYNNDVKNFDDLKFKKITYIIYYIEQLSKTNISDYNTIDINNTLEDIDKNKILDYIKNNNLFIMVYNREENFIYNVIETDIISIIKVNQLTNYESTYKLDNINYYIDKEKCFVSIELKNSNSTLLINHLNYLCPFVYYFNKFDDLLYVKKEINNVINNKIKQYLNLNLNNNYNENLQQLDIKSNYMQEYELYSGVVINSKYIKKHQNLNQLNENDVIVSLKGKYKSKVINLIASFNLNF